MVRAWIDTVRAQHAPTMQPVASAGHPRLANHFPAHVLQTARAATVTRIPFPPIVDLGLIEFADIAQMGLSAITFDDMIFVHQSFTTEAIYFHELVHVVQWRTLGIEQFMLTYAVGVLQQGYAHAPLEAIAYDLQSQFTRGGSLGDVEATIAAHAKATCALAHDVFNRHGVKMGSST